MWARRSEVHKTGQEGDVPPGGQERGPAWPGTRAPESKLTCEQ